MQRMWVGRKCYLQCSDCQVKLAAQVCWQTVYVGMTILSSHGKLGNDACVTAECLRNVNTSFDIHNVSTFDSKAAADGQDRTSVYRKYLPNNVAKSESTSCCCLDNIGWHFKICINKFG